MPTSHSSRGESSTPPLRPASPLRVNKIVVQRVSNDKLPPVRSFFEAELGCQFSRADRRGEVSGPCCFHQSKSGKSFKVNSETGLWYCHGCGFGGDLYSFVQRRHGLSFLDAAKYLGTLDDDGPPVKPPTEPVPYLVLEYDYDGTHYRSKAVKDEPRNYADKIRRFYCSARDRLTELRRSDPDAFTDDEEACWEQMAAALDECRELGIYE
jgi:hypothetical protein